MSFGLGLGIGLKALSAAQLGIQTAGQNVANINTPGYSRQRLLLAAGLPYAYGNGLQVGTGVDISDLSRIVDDGLERRLRLQVGLAGGATVEQGRWRELEGLFNEPDSGLSASLSDFFGRVGKLQTDASDRALRGGVVQGGRGLAQSFNLLANRLSDLRASTFTEVQALTAQVNQHAAAIAELNQQIVSLESTGGTANDLRDAREQHVKDIAELVDTQTVDRGTGAVDVLVGGFLLVGGTRASTLTAAKDTAGNTTVNFSTSGQPIRTENGKIGALLRHESAATPQVMQRIDELARNLALEWNRLHTTGVPRSGPFTTLTSFYGATDSNHNGVAGDELLSQAGLPFDVAAGELFVTVTHLQSGSPDRTRIAIDPKAMTLQDLAAQLNAIEHLSASVDPTGRLRIKADSGYGFDFGKRLDADPDTFGSFGGSAPSFGSSRAGPFDLGASLPATFTVTIDGTPRTVTLDPLDFANAQAATVDELAAAINADIGAFATARNVGGRLVLRSDTSGPSASMSLADGTGSPLAALGLATGSSRSGQVPGVAVAAQGKYTGSENGRLIFVPDADGTIGLTPGLTVSVYDDAGHKVATLDVGQGSYVPGDPIDVVDGVQVSFGPGSVSAAAGDVFALDTLADSDTTDVLVGLGLNSFFHGSSAADLAVNPDLEANPDLLAAGLSGAAGDADNLARMMALRSEKLSSLNASSLEDYYADLIGSVAFETASADATLQAQDQLLAHLQQQRESISGVNLDEEMVNMVQYQQAFEAASRFINVVNEITSVLINIGR